FYRKHGVYRPAVACAMGSQGGTGGFCFVCNAEMIRAIHRSAGRGPAGGVFPPAAPRLKLKGNLRRPCFFYSQGLFGQALADLDKLEGSGRLTEEEKRGANTLRKSVEACFEKERRVIEASRAGGDVLGARERLDLLEVSFRSTPFEAKVRELKKAMTSE